VRQVIYFAHPVGAPTLHEYEVNLYLAVRWLDWCTRDNPDAAFVASWLSYLLASIHHDHLPEDRARGMADNLAVAARCDGIVLCGGRVSPGMAAERDAVVAAGGFVLDLTSLGREPPK
jgi:hypothetical protein